MLNGKVIVVTGGAGLLGVPLCIRIAREGGTPIVADINISRAKAVASEIHKNDLTAQAVSLDITKRSQIEDAIVSVERKYGRIDAVVNNAYPRGKNYGRDLESVEYEDFCESLTLHLGGYFLTSQVFAAKFKSQGYGNIVNVASIYGLFAPRFDLYDGTSMTMPVEYAAIKAGVTQLTRYFAQYFGKSGVRCNAVAPGGIRDDQPKEFMEKYDLMCGNRGLLNPEDVVGALVFLLSDFSLFMTGQTLVVDDGWSL
jgi:NAD(P)-dependent dehydrogenase (short-subunit alcohol dehydrogenase family)